jgi:hypothetical protein
LEYEFHISIIIYIEYVLHIGYEFCGAKYMISMGYISYIDYINIIYHKSFLEYEFHISIIIYIEYVLHIGHEFRRAKYMISMGYISYML